MIILHYIVIKREFLSAILTATAMRGGGAAHQPFFLIATLLGKTRNLIFLAQIYRAYIIHFCFGMIRARKEQRRGEGRMVKWEWLNEIDVVCRWRLCLVSWFDINFAWFGYGWRVGLPMPLFIYFNGNYYYLWSCSNVNVCVS